ncbi:unnamed protein product [Arabis nemorensis]|uniref:Retrotransposon gag domain-containing protein n=1 Tax=Arabis nemorensis TaxID=586526 RepID=A0A565AXY5_9BRAS|nr:unnamed protein product [Arabis nemorensis]
MEELSVSYSYTDQSKFTTAVQNIKGEARYWWNYINKMRRSYKQTPITSWTEMKWHMRRRFAPGYCNKPVQNFCHQSHTKRHNHAAQAHKHPEHVTNPRANGALLFKEVKTESKQSNISTKQVMIHPQAVAQTSKPSSKSFLELDRKATEGSSNLMNSIDKMSYRCHKGGHFTLTCSTRHLFIPKSLELKTNDLKEDDNLVKSDFKFPNASVIHLSLSVDVETGLGAMEKHVVEEEIMYAQGPDLNQETLIVEPKSYGDEKLIEENKLDQKSTQGDFKPFQLESTNQQHDRGSPLVLAD